VGSATCLYLSQLRVREDSYPRRVRGEFRGDRTVLMSCTSKVLSAYTVHEADDDVVGFRLTVEQELISVPASGLLLSAAARAVLLAGLTGVAP
jgi:hypothetical protein